MAPRWLPLLGVLALIGCADVRVPTIVWDDGPVPGQAPPAELDTPDAVLTGARPIRRADPEGGDWPSLAAVPMRPTAFSSPVERQALMDRLKGEQAEADARALDLRSGEGELPPGGAEGIAAPAGAGDPGQVPEPRIPAAPPPVPLPVAPAPQPGG